MGRKVALVYSIAMFILTTLLVILIPIVTHPMDGEQILILVMICFMGYFASGTTFYYLASKK